jgi:hypothetical protein
METEWEVEGNCRGMGMVLVLEEMMDDGARWVVGSTRKKNQQGLSRWEDINAECRRNLGG